MLGAAGLAAKISYLALFHDLGIRLTTVRAKDKLSSVLTDLLIDPGSRDLSTENKDVIPICSRSSKLLEKILKDMFRRAVKGVGNSIEITENRLIALDMTSDPRDLKTLRLKNRLWHLIPGLIKHLLVIHVVWEPRGVFKINLFKEGFFGKSSSRKI